jgi:hypothetical protein
MDLDHYLTIKRNIRLAKSLDETGITSLQLMELIQALDDMKSTLRTIYQTSHDAQSKLLAANVLGKYFEIRR